MQTATAVSYRVSPSLGISIDNVLLDIPLSNISYGHCKQFAAKQALDTNFNELKFVLIREIRVKTGPRVIELLQDPIPL